MTHRVVCDTINYGQYLRRNAIWDRIITELMTQSRGIHDKHRRPNVFAKTVLCVNFFVLVKLCYTVISMC